MPGCLPYGEEGKGRGMGEAEDIGFSPSISGRGGGGGNPLSGSSSASLPGLPVLTRSPVYHFQVFKALPLTCGRVGFIGSTASREGSVIHSFCLPGFCFLSLSFSVSFCSLTAAPAARCGASQRQSGMQGIQKERNQEPVVVMTLREARRSKAVVLQAGGMGGVLDSYLLHHCGHPHPHPNSSCSQPGVLLALSTFHVTQTVEVPAEEHLGGGPILCLQLSQG